MAKPIYLLLIALACVCGCARLRPDSPVNYRTIESSGNKDPQAAREAHNTAIGLLSEQRCCEAEQFLHEALISDVSFGPAHNTLGKLYYDQKKFYLAAWEFEHAIKTLPDRAEPFNNLGLVFESVDQFEKAVANFQIAYEIDQDNPQYLGNLLRARVQRGDLPESMQMEFERLIFIDTRRSWVKWAKSQLVESRKNQSILACETCIPAAEFESEIPSPMEAPPEPTSGFIPTSREELGPALKRALPSAKAAADFSTPKLAPILPLEN